MQDKRSHERLIVIGEVILKDELDNSIIAEGFLENISYVGAAISLRKEIIEGKDVIAEFRMSSLSGPVCIKSRVKHVKQSMRFKYPVFRVGLEFTDVDKGKVDYVVKRIYAMIAEEKRKQRNIKPPDFIAY